jgi:hypothetical protein
MELKRIRSLIYRIMLVRSGRCFPLTREELTHAHR